MADDHSVEIALLTQRLGQLEIELQEHRKESRADREELQKQIAAQTAKMQTLIDAWNSATILGKLLGVLASIATVIGGLAVLKGLFK